MNEKVLGLKFKSKKLYSDVKYTFSENFVPVNLKSKSVTVKWLEKFCKEHEVKSGYGIMPFIHSYDLLKAVRKKTKEASK